MPVSEKRVQANRANAAKSTGPKTTQGKARSRANALKHGMAGSGVVLPAEDRARWEDRADAWAEELGALDDLGRFLAGRAALASVRLDRCVRAETAAVQNRRAQALTQWHGDRQDHARIAVHSAKLNTEPALAVAGLQASARGCEWLIESWQDLAHLLAAEGFWDQKHTGQVLSLLGTPTPEVTSRAWKACLALSADFHDPEDLVWAERVLEITAPEADPASRRATITAALPDRAEAHAWLTALHEAERATLQARRQGLWERVDEPARRRALALAAFDDSEAASLRRRYESASTSDLHRALNQIHQNRRERDCEPTAPESDTVLRNEPNEPEALAAEVVEETGVVGIPPHPAHLAISPELTPTPAAESAAVVAPRNEPNDVVAEAAAAGSGGVFRPATAASGRVEMRRSP